VVEVMIDGPSSESEWLVDARHEGQAPGIDGKIVVTDAPAGTTPGTFLPARITHADAHDFVATADLTAPHAWPDDDEAQP
jgi:ribosomal protein S12 methylthiotransferase